MKSEKGKVGIIICIILIVLLIAGCGALYYFGFMEKDKKIDELEANKKQTEIKVTELENKISELENKIAEEEKDTIFELAVKDNLVLIDDMILLKESNNFSSKEFTDEEIIRLLPDSKEVKIFSYYGEESYQKADISDVEKSAKEIFGKDIDVKKAVENTANENVIRIEGSDVVVAGRTGAGVYNATLISISEVTGNEYKIEFKFISGDNEDIGTYKLTVEYENGAVIYKTLEK